MASTSKVFVAFHLQDFAIYIIHEIKALNQQKSVSFKSRMKKKQIYDQGKRSFD